MHTDFVSISLKLLSVEGRELFEWFCTSTVSGTAEICAMSAGFG